VSLASRRVNSSRTSDEDATSIDRIDVAGLWWKYSGHEATFTVMICCPSSEPLQTSFMKKCEGAA
jgi:predicted solute-binding protein